MKVGTAKMDIFISGDWAGISATRLEETIGQGAVVAVLNGSAGNVKPVDNVLADVDDPRAERIFMIASI